MHSEWLCKTSAPTKLWHVVINVINYHVISWSFFAFVLQLLKGFWDSKLDVEHSGVMPLVTHSIGNMEC